MYERVAQKGFVGTQAALHFPPVYEETGQLASTKELRNSMLQYQYNTEVVFE